MIHAPLRGIVALARLGIVVAAVAAIPLILKRSKPAAQKVGDALIDLGKRLKEDASESAKKGSTTPKGETEKKSEAKAAPTAQRATQAKPKAAPTRKATARPKPRKKA